jgi:hypothetical protein
MNIRTRPARAITAIRRSGNQMKLDIQAALAQIT